MTEENIIVASKFYSENQERRPLEKQVSETVQECGGDICFILH